MQIICNKVNFKHISLKILIKLTFCLEMDFIKNIFDSINNQTDNFTYEIIAIDGIYKFLSAIDWTEKWIISLLMFHFLIFILIILSRNHFKLQSSLFGFLRMFF